jgi:stage II sporulation protein GA (sporulation sigma-E factor processing peptidase)
MSFYIGSFIFAGATMGVFFFKNNGFKILDKALKSINNFPVKYLVIGVGFSSLIAILVFKYFNIHKMKNSFIAEVELFYENKRLDFKALMDTGNSLIDPISKKKVMIVEYEKLSEILPAETKDLILAADHNDYLEIEQILDGLKDYIKLIPIPFKSVGKSGIMFGFKPDSIIIKYMNKVLIRQDIIIGIYNNTFPKDLGYNGLLHYEIIDGGVENEIYKIQA